MPVLLIVKLALQGVVSALDVALPLIPDGELKNILTQVDKFVKGALNGGELSSALKKEQQKLSKLYKDEDGGSDE